MSEKAAEEKHKPGELLVNFKLQQSLAAWNQNTKR